MKLSYSQVAKSCLVAAALALPTLPLHAAPVEGPSGMAFYTPPATTGAKGDLIWYRPATVKLGSGAPGYQAWNLMYHSTDALGKPNVVTGTVIVPKAAWRGLGARPVISYAVGTHGLNQSCAPSLQLAQGTDYESANIAAALQAGYSVLISDNPGYTNGDTPTYLAGKAQGHAVLDIIKAAAQIPGAGVSASAKAAIWGYSQGGQTASWAAELKDSYAPGINLVGVAAGGTPANFPAIAHYLDGSTGASFLMQAIVGLGTQYPDHIPVEELASARGLAMMETAKQQCVFESLFDVMNESISSYTVDNLTLDQLMTIPPVHETLVEQNLGKNRISVPLYQYHGQADEFIPLDQHIALKKQYCQKYSNVTFDLYPSEHIVTQFQAAPYVLSWLGDRFNGRPTLGNCVTLKPEPKSTANPGGGNFVVSLKDWKLDATIGLNTLKQDITLPAKSTFTADTDMTAQVLDGTLSIPTFKQKLNIVLPLDVVITVSPAERARGTVSLNDQGILQVQGTAHTYIKVNSAGLGLLQIPFGCQTERSVAFPINFEGPVSALGSGDLTFNGTTSFPPMKSCGLFNSLFTVLMSGAGQSYSFNVTPPAPTRW